MNNPMTRHTVPWKVILKSVLALCVLGFCMYGFEHSGEQYLSRLSAFVVEQGRVGIILFIAINAVATMFLVPQSVFTVMAGALFGWKFGTAWASVGMTIGATGSFFLARYGVRTWLRVKFQSNAIFVKMLRLSRSHPLHVISLSRLIPVIPFPLASYLLGVTEVRSLHFALLTWLCMLPETVFLASGGHLLHSGITKGHGSVELVIVLGVAAAILGVVVHRVKKHFLENEERD